jgi:hypothetical protein
VSRNVQAEIIEIVVRELLAVDNPSAAPDVWNGGGTLPISRVSAAIPAALLAEIKNEFGGLQASICWTSQPGVSFMI